MARITLELLRKRAEHNDGVLSNLHEIALHQQNLERIELVGSVCRGLKILLLQNNLVSKLENLQHLKALEYLNIALNNLTRVENLHRCESLAKLDLSVNFIDRAALPSLASLQGNHALRTLLLTGNPCTQWSGYRQFVVATLPRLRNLDGVDITAQERFLAHERLPQLQAALQVDGSLSICRDGSSADTNEGIAACEAGGAGYVGEDGEVRRPWSRATRLLEHRETAALQRAAEEQRGASTTSLLMGTGTCPQRRSTFPTIQEGDSVRQKNEGHWNFTLQESSDKGSVVLDVALAKHLDTSLIDANVQPAVVQLLIKGLLLQLMLPQRVLPEQSSAQRSLTTGHLVLVMPKEDPADTTSFDVALTRCSKANVQPHPASARVAHASAHRAVVKQDVDENTVPPLQELQLSN